MLPERNLKNRWRHRLRIVDQSLTHRALTTKPRTTKLTAARQMYNKADRSTPNVQQTDGSTPNVQQSRPQHAKCTHVRSAAGQRKENHSNNNFQIISNQPSLRANFRDVYHAIRRTDAPDVKAAAQTCRRQESRREEDRSQDVKKVGVKT